ncbi:MAG: protein adenylyltransferase SelO family protein [Pseudomonadota bacterium]
MSDTPLPRLSPGLAELGEPLVVPWQASTALSDAFASIEVVRAELGTMRASDTAASARALAAQLVEGTWPGGSWPVALDYAGHQFGRFNAALGDGRVVQLGECAGPDGLVEIGLKGVGRTALASRGDGWAGTRECVAEFDTYRALQRLGVPTARGLLVVTGVREVHRGGRLEPVALLCRTAPSFVRFGCFELHFRLGRHAALQRLCDHVIPRHFPECAGHADTVARFFDAVVARTARLYAAWQAVRFVHGVPNTDNQSIVGVTLDAAHGRLGEGVVDATVVHPDDRAERFAFGNQALTGWWNCRVLAAALSPLAAQSALHAALDNYTPIYRSALADWVS